MKVLRAMTVITVALCVPMACGRKESPADAGAPAPSISIAPSAHSALSDLASAAATTPAPESTFPTTLESALVPGTASSPAPAPAPAPAPDSSVSAAPSTSAPTPGPWAARLVGTWGFKQFDLTDPTTASKWAAVPPTMQQEILAEAPKASIEFTPQKLISRLSGVPDKVSAWSIESEGELDLVIKTDEGRKKIRFPETDTMRIEELDKKGQFVTLFARRKPGALAPSASASSSAGK